MKQSYQDMREAIESLLETLEILQDKELMAAFREGVQALQNGELVDWEDAKREMGQPLDDVLKELGWE